MNLDGLQKPVEGIAVSIYMPTHRRWEETEEDKIRLKNILKKIEKQIPKDKEILVPISKLLDNEDFWKQQKDGLAIFASKNNFDFVNTPHTLKEQYYINGRFNLSPLPKHLFEPIEYYVLAISQKDVRLLKIHNHEAREIQTEQLPKNLKEALWVDDDPQKSIQQKSSKKSGPRTKGGAMVYHGHGANVEPYKENLSRFFNEIDQKINKIIIDKTKPLILACVEYHYPIYKKENKYPKLADEFIPGNPETLKNHEIAEKSLVIAAYEFNF